MGPTTGATGGTIAAPFLLNTDQTVDNQFQPQAIAIDEDSFLIAWVDGNTQRIRGATVSVDGDIENGPFDISTSAVQQNFELGLTQLAGGRIVVSYRTDTFDSSFRVLFSTGSPATAEIDFDGVAAGTGATSVAALADGRFAMVVLKGGTIVGRVFDSNGNLSVPEFDILAAGDFPKAIGLPDGRFFVINGSGGELFGQMMKADGTKDGGTVAINTVTTGTQSNADLTLLADGRIAVAWQTNENGNNDIKVTILDPRETGVEIAGTALADDYVGSAFEDVIVAGAGNDVVDGAGGDDVIAGGSGNDSLFGGGGADSLRGGSGNDSLDGGAGVDVMEGGLGDDIFAVDNAADQAVELTGEGNDRVLASVNYRLLAGSAIELLTAANPAGTGALDLAGNELAQTILGNDGANTLEGLAGDDVLQGFGGNDSLDGGTGADTMFGGGGDDIYVADDAGDQVIEAAGQGNDRILASVNYQLGVGSEVELLAAANLAGTGALDLAGNDLAQTIIGNAGINNLVGLGGNDTLHSLEGDDGLDGGAGTDTMAGGTGNDVYIVDNAGDQAIELAGQGANDRVLASVSYTLNIGSEIELLAALDLAGTGTLDLSGNELGQTIIGNAGVNALGGGGGNDTLQGLEGSDLLDGGLGADMLVGGTGADLLVFTSALGGGNIDTIIGFTSGTDGIALFSGVFAGLAPGALPASAFVVGNGALDADDRIIYNSATGALFFDVDGNGGVDAVQFAVLQGAPALAASDFTVI